MRPLAVPILMYHRIAEHGSAALAQWRTTPAALDAQLRLLRDAGFASVTLEELRGGALTRRPVLITFDDGYVDFAQAAAPLLRRHGFGAVVYAVTDLVGRTNAWDARFGETIALMDWPALRRLEADGFEVGSHSSRHAKLTTLSPDALAEDLAGSRRTLERELGHPVHAVSYPHGDHDARVLEAARAAGYTSGVTIVERAAELDDDPLALPRLEVRGDMTLDAFAALVGA